MTNLELYRRFKFEIEAVFIAKMREGEDTEEIVVVLVDPDDPEVPDALADALEIEDEEGESAVKPIPFSDLDTDFPTSPSYRLGTLLREPLRELLLDTHPTESAFLDNTTSLIRAPCLVIAGGELVLYFFRVPALSWVAGGDA